MNRNDFPYLKENPEIIYFDSGSTAPMPEIVVNELTNYYAKEFASLDRNFGKHQASLKNKINQLEKKILELFPENFKVYFQYGTTFALNNLSYILKVNFQDAICIIDANVHNSCYLPFQRNFKEKLIKVDFTNYEETDKTIQRLSTENNKIIICASTHSNLFGYNENVEKIMKKYNDEKYIRVNDGAQAFYDDFLKQEKIDYIDFYVATFHKINGPTGIGFTVTNQNIKLNKIGYQIGGQSIDSFDDNEFPSFVENVNFCPGGTFNLGVIAPANKTLDFLLQNRIEIKGKLVKLSTYLYKELEKINNITIINKKPDKLISFTINNDLHPHDLANILLEENILIRSGKVCNYMGVKQITNDVPICRISLGVFNTTDEIDLAIKIINESING